MKQEDGTSLSTIKKCYRLRILNYTKGDKAETICLLKIGYITLYIKNGEIGHEVLAFSSPIMSTTLPK